MFVGDHGLTWIEQYRRHEYKLFAREIRYRLDGIGGVRNRLPSSEIHRRPNFRDQLSTISIDSGSATNERGLQDARDHGERC